MKCQNCHEIIEPDATFCGNCGKPVQASVGVPILTQQATLSPNITQETTALPGYALASPYQHIGENSAILAVICGIIGTVGGVLLPAMGLGFGVLGLVFGTDSKRRSKHRIANIGLIFSLLAIVVGVGSYVHNVNLTNDSQTTARTGNTYGSSKVLAILKTPCYRFNLIDQYNVSNSPGSCDATIYNGQTFDQSTDIYKIIADPSSTTDPGEFTELVKAGIEKDVQDNLAGYAIVSQGPTSFAGSLAYSAHVTNSAQGASGIEEAVLHKGSTKNNVYVIVHIVVASSTNLQTLEAEWQWQ